MKTKFQFVVLLNAILLFANCASYKAERFREYLGSMVSIMTYDQAIMNWGTPLSQTEGDEIFVAIWGAENVGAAAMPVGNMVIAVPVKRGWKLMLGFDKETRKMVSWRYDRW